MVDMSKLRAMREQLAASNKDFGDREHVLWWRPEAGTNRIRILPPWTDEGFHAGAFWREVAQHWQVSPELKGPVVCPRNTPGVEDDDCPICDLVDQLRGMKNDPGALELANNLRAKKNYLLNVLNLDDPEYTARDVANFKKERPDAEVPFAAGDPKIQVYAAGITVFQQILAIIDENDKNITDLKEGHDIKIEKTGKGFNTKYTLTIILKSSPVENVDENTELTDLSKVGMMLTAQEAMQRLTENTEASQYATDRALPSGDSAGGLPEGVSRGVKKADDDDLPESYTGGGGGDLEDELAAALRG